MERRVKIQMREGVAIVTLAALPEPDAALAPADPGFEPELRARLAGALDLVLDDPAAKAVLLRAGPGGWPVAADPLSDWHERAGVPGMAELAARLEHSGKPVVMALSGRVVGGTLALALAAGWRLASAEARLALPEQGLAALPGGDVLWRLVRAAGAQAVLRLALSGREVNARQVAAMGVFDGVVEQGDVDAAALSVAHAFVVPAPEPPPPPRRDPASGVRDAVAFLAAVAEARQALPASAERAFQARMIDCVEAALLLPEAEAREFVEVARAEFAAAPLGRALAHVAAAERRAAMLAGLPAARPLTPQRIGVWQPGVEAAHLIGALAEAGFALTLAAADAEALAPVLTEVARLQAAAEDSGRLSAPEHAAAWERLEAGIDPAALTGCGLVLAPADSAARLRPDLALDCQLVVLGAPPEAMDDCAALLLPAPGLAEVTPGAATAPEAIATVLAVLQGARQICLRAGAGRGGITARLWVRLQAAAERVVLAGATPAQVDAALTGLGLAEPPFRRADRIGPDPMVAEARGLGHEPGMLSLLLAELGPQGAPWRYYDAASGAPDPETEALLPSLRQELGLVPVALDGATIRARVLAELADEGAGMLQTGQAHRAGDVDLAALHGLGLARTAGGPMFAADSAGLLATRESLRALTGEGAPPPATLWDVLIKNGRHFGELDLRARG